jgi:hypothetical protein
VNLPSTQAKALKYRAGEDCYVSYVTIAPGRAGACPEFPNQLNPLPPMRKFEAAYVARHEHTLHESSHEQEHPP